MKPTLHVTTPEDTTPADQAADAGPTVRLLRLEEAAERMNVSVKYLYAHRRQFRWIVELSPRVLRADEAALLRFIERRKG